MPDRSKRYTKAERAFIAGSTGPAKDVAVAFSARFGRDIKKRAVTRLRLRYDPTRNKNKFTKEQMQFVLAASGPSDKAIATACTAALGLPMAAASVKHIRRLYRDGKPIPPNGYARLSREQIEFLVNTPGSRRVVADLFNAKYPQPKVDVWKVGRVQTMFGPAKPLPSDESFGIIANPPAGQADQAGQPNDNNAQQQLSAADAVGQEDSVEPGSPPAPLTTTAAMEQSQPVPMAFPQVTGCSQAQSHHDILVSDPRAHMHGFASYGNPAVAMHNSGPQQLLDNVSQHGTHSSTAWGFNPMTTQHYQPGHHYSNIPDGTGYYQEQPIQHHYGGQVNVDYNRPSLMQHQYGHYIGQSPYDGRVQLAPLHEGWNHPQGYTYEQHAPPHSYGFPPQEYSEHNSGSEHW